MAATGIPGADQGKGMNTNWLDGLAWQALALASGAFVGAIASLIAGDWGDISYVMSGAIGSLVAFNLSPADRGRRLP